MPQHKTDTRYLSLLIRFNVLASPRGKRLQKYNLFPFYQNIFSFFFAFFLIYLFYSTIFFAPPPQPSTLLSVASGEKGLFSAVFYRTSLCHRKRGYTILMSINILDLLSCLNIALGQRFMKINVGQVAFSGSGDATYSQRTGSVLGAYWERTGSGLCFTEIT